MKYAAFIAFLLSAGAATAQVCAPHEKLKSDLGKNHGEKPFIMLVQSNGSVLEILANPEKQNWTVLNVSPNGWSCIMGAGNGYVSKLGKPGEDS